jgi:hypothetical protein
VLGTRPDIVHAVIMMSQFMVNPSEDHINKSLHIVRYVNTNLNSKIGYDGKQEVLESPSLARASTQ